MKSKLVILDAVIIIEAHRLGIWNHLLSQFSVFIPGYILDNEVQYFKSKGGSKIAIDLTSNTKNLKVHRLDAEPTDFAKLYQEFNQVFVDGIDNGEKEALALLNSGRYPEHKFCTSDGAAIKALSVLNLSFQGISLEELLQQSGKKYDLKHNFCKSFYTKHLGHGLQDRDFLKKK
jgi:hypothetical protein